MVPLPAMDEYLDDDEDGVQEEPAGTPLPMVGYSHPRMFLLKCLLIVPARMGDRPG